MAELGIVRHVDGGLLPRWLRSSSVAWTGALLACIVMVLTAAFLFHEKQSLDTSDIQSAELYARVLQDHAERTLNTVDIAMVALADTVGVASSGNLAALSKDLSQAASGLAFLRSLSVLRADGRVIASSSAGNLGVVVDVGAVRFPVAGATDALGTSVNGRDLDEATVGRAASAASSRTFVPIVRAIDRALGERLYLVAALNPDFFSNAYGLTLADTTRGAGIFSMDGVMLAGTENIQKAPGQRAADHAVFKRYLPARESGSFIGPGIDGNAVVTAFRVLRKRPMVVIVERSYSHVLASFRDTVLRALGAGFGALLVIAGMVVMGWRSLRSREAVGAALEATRLDVAARERDLRALVESVHELIFRSDADGKVTFVNGRWSELTGRPVQDVLGKRFSALCQEGERAPCDALFAARRTRETILVHIESRAACMHAFELSVSPLTDADGSAVGHAGFAVEVSGREAAQRALQSQLKFTQRLLDVSPTPIFVKDERGRFVTVNRAWLELMDLTLPDVLGRNSADLFGHDAPRHEDQDARLLLSEERISYENRLVVAGRSPRDTVVAKVRFTRAGGTVAGIVGSIVDVTEFREAERNIRKARDAAQQANSAKSEFIANISHELRTPLQGILGFSEIGLDLSGDRPDFLDLFTDIHAGGRRMLTLVNGLLDVSQMDSAMGSLALQRANVAQLVRDAVQQLQPAWTARGLTFALHGLDGRVDGNVDRDRFQQAVRNVLENAVRFSPTGGEIAICLTLRGQLGIELTIQDGGPGVPADELEAIFDAFVQSSRTRDGSGGAGLGLTIARKIMRAHGGSIAAANACGGGTLMRLWLPAAGESIGMNTESAWHDVDALPLTPEPA